MLVLLTSMIFRNFGMFLHAHAALQRRTPTASSPGSEPQISCCTDSTGCCLGRKDAHTSDNWGTSSRPPAELTTRPTVAFCAARVGKHPRLSVYLICLSHFPQELGNPHNHSLLEKTWTETRLEHTGIAMWTDVSVPTHCYNWPLLAHGCNDTGYHSCLCNSPGCLPDVNARGEARRTF
jgi:hypothetical protein